VGGVEEHMVVDAGRRLRHAPADRRGDDIPRREVLERVDDAADPLNALNAYQFAAQHRAIANDRAATVPLADRVIELASEHGIRANEAEARIMKGWVIRDADLVRQGAAMLADMGLRASEPTQHLALAQIHCEADRIDEADAEVAAGLVAAEASGEARHVAELYRAQAACARRRGRTDAADASLRKAIEIAHAQGSRLFVLRAAADLGELLAADGRRDDARALVAPLCDGFVPDDMGPELSRVRALAAS